MVLRTIVAFSLAVVVTEIGVALVNTTSVLLRLSEIGVELSARDWAGTYLADILGMASTFFPVLAIGFAIAFAVAAAVVRWLLPGWHRIGYPLAGSVCLLVVVLGVNSIFGTHPIAATRSLLGLVMVCLAGAVGGLLFERVSGARRPAPVGP